MSILERPRERHIHVGGGAGRIAPEWPLDPTLREAVKHGLPRPGLGTLPDGTAIWRWRARNRANLWRGLRQLMWARVHGIPMHYGALYLDLIDAEGRSTPIGLASLRVVTTAGVSAIVDAFQNTVELETFIYHGFGTGGAAEATSNTGLTTELTTEYAVDNTRPTGTATENGATVFRSVATLDPDSAVTITEHMLASQAATGGGILMDRSLFTGVGVAASGDTLQATYDLTFTPGG